MNRITSLRHDLSELSKKASIIKDSHKKVANKVGISVVGLYKIRIGERAKQDTQHNVNLINRCISAYREVMNLTVYKLRV